MADRTSDVPTHRLIAERYALIEEIGRGGMGTVWRAQDTLLGRAVAIKELHLPDGTSASDRAGFSDRLMREARSAARLNHPGIVTVHDVVVSADGSPCIVMELVESRTLADVVRTHGPMLSSTASAVALQVLDALDTAHRAGIVHRDVKPANILVRPNGQVELTDFGIALASDDPRLTTTGILVGSPGYLSPERLENAAAGPESDLWSLGATLFFAVEGRAPFERDTTAATLYAVLHEQPRPARAHGPLADVIVALMARSPRERPGVERVRAMLAASGPPQSGIPTGRAASPDRPAGPGRSDRRRRLTRIGLGVAVVAAFALGVTATVVVTDRASNPGAAAVTTLTYGPGGDLPAFDLNVTTCASGPLTPGRVVASEASTTCTSPHDWELYATADTWQDSVELTYPGEEEIGRYAQAWCGLVFSSAQVTGDDKADLTITALVPDEQAFTERESATSSSRIGRDVYCVLARTDGAQLVGKRLAAP